MAKSEKILAVIDRLRAETGVSRTLFAACPNSIAVIKAAFRAAKRNNGPIKFAATLNQVDTDGGYTGLNQEQFARLLRIEAAAVNYTGPYIVAIDHGGPWLKDIQSAECWDVERAMNGVKKSFEEAVAAGYDLIHVDPTVDIFLEKGATIPIKVVAKRTVELILHTEQFRRTHGYSPISYEVGTEEVHGGLADEATFDTFIDELKRGLKEVGLAEVWPCFIVGKVGTDLHTTTFDTKVAINLTNKARSCGSYIKGHYTDGVENPQDYPLCGIGAANVGPEFTISEYRALAELEELELHIDSKQKVAQLSHITRTLRRLVHESNRWQKWLRGDEVGKGLSEISKERQDWLVQTGCRYIWQKPEALVARQLLYDNLNRVGVNAEEVVLSRIEHDMDKYYYAFNLTDLNDYLTDI